MDGFDKLYKRSKLNRTHKTPKSNQWLKNATRSIGRSALDVVNEYVPAVMETGVSVRDIRTDLRDTLMNTKKSGIVKAGSLMSMGKSLWKNSLDDLKSGNLYNKERIEASENDGFGDFNLPDFDEDFDFGEDSGNYSVDVTSDDGQSSVQMNHASDNGGNDVTQINIETNLGKNSAFVQATQQQTEISIKTAQQLADVSINNTKIMMAQLSKLSTTLSGQLSSINDNVSSIATVVSENISSHISISGQYYEDSLAEFREIKELVTDIKETIRMTSSTSQLDHDVQDRSSPFSVFNSGGGLNLREYGALVKKQFEPALMSTPLGLLFSFAKMSSMPGMDMTAEFRSSPISSLIKMTMKKMIPTVVKTSVETFNDQLKESLTTGLVRLGGLRNSTNPVHQFIGNLFGIKNSKYTASKKNYNKGPMAWNGIAHRTLVDVIPNYLSQIAAAVTGTEQKVFDYEQGKYESLKNIREDYDKTKKRNQLSAHWDIRNEFDKFVRNFNMSSSRKDEFTDKFDDYLMKLSNSLGNMNFTNSEQTKSAVGGDEEIAKMIQQFMRFAPKQLVTATYGRNALQANEDVSDYERRIEKDPTGYNAQYIKNGLTTISPSSQGGILGNKVDKYNHDNLYYLRKILQTINTAVPVRIIKGGKGFNKKMLSGLGAENTISSILRDENNGGQNTNTEVIGNRNSSGMSLDTLNLSPEELKTKIKENNKSRYLDDDEEKDPFLMRVMKTFKVKEDSNIYKLALNASNMKKNTDNKTASFFDKLSDTMFALLFGEGDDHGVKGLFNRAIGGVKVQMGKFGSFIDNKLIGPLNESLFGEDGLITSIKESESAKKFKEKISNAKEKAVEFLFGEKDDDGKRSGGLFSDTFNSISDMGTSAKNFILHDEDGVVGSLKGMYRSIVASVKKSLGVEDTATEKVPISKKIASGASDFLTHIKARGSEWMDLIFGGKDTKTEDAKEEIISGFNIFKEDMKGKKGKLGASATLGILGSFFLPGGPIAGALLGLGTGIVSESTQLKDFLFGKLGEDDERVGGVVSREFQKFFKDHKTGIATGALAGTMASIGLLPSFFVPGGPIGGALIGGAIALAHKSGVFNDLLYGEDGSEDNVTGGITKFIKDHYKKDGNIKSTFMDAGIGAGVGIIGSFFLPGGPIIGALLGSAASIAINTDKFKNLMFGEEILDENGKSTGKRKGGLFGKFTGYIGDKVLLPLSNAARETQVKILGFIEEHMVNPLKVAMKPFQLAGKNFMDGVRATIGDLKESFRQKVTKPIGDAVEEHIIKPMGKAFSKIFGGIGKIFGSIISAPFRMIQGIASGVNKDHKKKGQTDYDVNSELEKENEKTRAKYESKLKDVKEENKKRTKWRNPFDTSRKKKEYPAKNKSEHDEQTKVSSKPYTKEEQDDIYNELRQQAEEKRSQKHDQSSETKVRTEPILPYNMQFFASSKKNENSGSNETTISDSSTKKKGSPLSMKFFSRNKGKSNNDQESTTAVSDVATSAVDLDPITSLLRSIDGNVLKITNSVDGQLNGVGYNVNKILRILLKKNGMTDEDVAGENNKKYSRGGRLLSRLKGIVFAPFRLIKSGITGAVEAVRGVISGAVEGVTKIAKGLLSIPKALVKTGISVVKGIGNAALGIAKGVGKAISTGLDAVGNVITSAATGFGNMIGSAAEGFGQLVGGALGGLGQLLHGVGLITKELAPVIGKGIATIIKAPFKLAGVAGSFVSKLFGRRKTRNAKDGGKVSHVIVDEYLGEDRVIDALRSIEFAILHGAPMDGEGPKFKGTSVIPVDKPGEKEERQEEQEEQATKMSLPFNLQFFANKGKNGNGLPNVAKAQTKEQEDAELQTRIAEGSASEINERFDAEDDKKEERSFREKLLGLFKSNNKEQKKQGINWSAIFSKKGLITGALIALAPIIIKLLPGLLDFIQNVGSKLLSWLGNTAKDVVENAESQGGLTGIMNGLEEVKTSISNLTGAEDREEYKIGDNGEIITDENGNPVMEVQKDGIARRVSEFFTPTTTKIDHETGEAYQQRQYDATTRAKVHATRSTAVYLKKKGKKIVNAVKTTLNHVPGGKRLQQGTKNLITVGKFKVSNAKDAAKAAIGEKYTNFYNNRIAGTKGVSEQVADAATKVKSAGADFLNKHEKIGTVVDAVKTKAGDLASNVKTTTAAKIKGTKIEKIIELGKDAFNAVKDKFTELIQKHAKGANTSKLVKFLDDAAKTIFKPSTITKFFGKFSKLLSKIATMASTLATSEIFWGITGALEGATNAAYTFEVSDEDVDWKMRLIAGAFRALLATSIGGWVDLADSILYEITGTSFVNQLAVLVYDLISSEEDSVDLQDARKKFNENYNKYVEEEYQKYAENQELNGQAAMSLDEFKASSLSTSRQEYNSEQNKSFVKRVWDGAQSLGRKVGNSKVGKFVGATVKKTNDAIIGGAKKVGGAVLDGAKNVGGAIVDGAQSLGRKVGNSKVGKFVGATVKKTNDAIIGGAKNVGSFIKNIVSGTMNAGKLVIDGIAGILKNAWTGDKEDLITLPKDTEDPSTIFAKYALIGANVLATPLKLMIKIARKVFDTAKLAWEGIKLTGRIAGNAIGGRLSAAWKGEDYEPPEVDESQPITKIASILDAGIGFLISPITLTVRGVRKVFDTAKLAWEGIKLTGRIAGNAIGGRLSAAWKGEDYEPPEVDESQPITKIASILDAGIGFLMSPITLTVRGIGTVVRKTQQLGRGLIKMGGQVVKSTTGRISAAWKGEDYEPDDFDDETPEGKILGAVDGVTGILISPITVLTKGVHAVVSGLSTVVNTVKDIGTSIVTYANVFDGKTSIKDYWKVPDKDDGPLGAIKTVMFYIVRTAMFVPFMITKLVTTIKDGVVSGVKWVADKVGGVFNDIANLLGSGSAFNVEDTGGNGTGLLGGFGDKPTAPKKTNLNGFTYYSQNDTTIKDQSYNQTDGTPGTMGERGCGPTALSMVASELTGQEYDPITMAKLSEGLGYSTDVGTTTGYFDQVGSTLGMGVSSGKANPIAIRESLNSGNPVILQGMGDGPYTSGGHYVVGVGMKDGKVLVNDPRGAQYSRAYSMSELMDGASGMWSFSGGKGPTTSAMEGDPRFSVTGTSTNQAAEQAVVKAIYSVKERNQYSQSAREHVGDTLTGAAQGSGDCSSTVRWAYKQALGIDPGSYTGEQVNSPTGYNVDQGTGGPPNESNLRPGDLLFYTKSGRNTHAAADVGHVEMYVGNDTLMGHGSGIGPKERQMSTYRLADYIGARRFIGDGANVVNNFDGVSTGSSGTSIASSGDTSNNPLSGGFSLSNLFSGAVSAVSDGINKFFGINTSSSNSSDATALSTGDLSTVNVDPSQEKESVWKFFRNTMGYTPESTAAVMGNMEQESGVHAVRVQGDYSSGYQKSQEYTKSADNGGPFVGDGKGYGLIQFTYGPLKQELLDAAKSQGKSVGDLGLQLSVIKRSLEGGGVLGNELVAMNNSFKTNTDMLDATKQWLNIYEKPGGDRNAEANKRLGFAQSIYNQYSNLPLTSSTSAMAGDPRFSATGASGGFGDGKKSKPTNIAQYQSNKTLQSHGAQEQFISTNQRIRKLQAPVTSNTTINSNTFSSTHMNKIFEYLGKIITYLESTSSGIDKLNEKDFGGTQNYVNSPSYTNITGSNQQSSESDTSNYELGKRIAYGQLT